MKNKLSRSWVVVSRQHFPESECWIICWGNYIFYAQRKHIVWDRAVHFSNRSNKWHQNFFVDTWHSLRAATSVYHLVRRLLESLFAWREGVWRAVHCFTWCLHVSISQHSINKREENKRWKMSSLSQSVWTMPDRLSFFFFPKAALLNLHHSSSSCWCRSSSRWRACLIKCLKGLPLSKQIKKNNNNNFIFLPSWSQWISFSVRLSNFVSFQGLEAHTRHV